MRDQWRTGADGAPRPPKRDAVGPSSDMLAESRQGWRLLVVGLSPGLSKNKECGVVAYFVHQPQCISQSEKFSRIEIIPHRDNSGSACMATTIATAAAMALFGRKPPPPPPPPVVEFDATSVAAAILLFWVVPLLLTLLWPAPPPPPPKKEKGVSKPPLTVTCPTCCFQRASSHHDPRTLLVLPNSHLACCSPSDPHTRTDFRKNAACTRCNNPNDLANRRVPIVGGNWKCNPAAPAKLKGLIATVNSCDTSRCEVWHSCCTWLAHTATAASPWHTNAHLRARCMFARRSYTCHS